MRRFAGLPETSHRIITGIDLSQAERFVQAALSEPSRHAAIQFLTAMLPEVADLPGLRMFGASLSVPSLSAL